MCTQCTQWYARTGFEGVCVCEYTVYGRRGEAVCGKLFELKSSRSKRGQTLQQLPQKLHSSCRRSYTAAAAEAKHHLQLLRLALRKGLCIRATGATYTTSTEAKHNNNSKSCDNIGDSATSTNQAYIAAAGSYCNCSRNHEEKHRA